MTDFPYRSQTAPDYWDQQLKAYIDEGDDSVGSVWRDGTTVPSNALGSDGDYYLRTTNGDVYAKDAGVYSVVGNIKGPAGSNGIDGDDGTNGADGSIWRNGAGAPSNALGSDGDYYLNNTNGDVYTKEASTYSVVANIKGAAGTNGTNGAVWRDGTGAPANGLGANGDYYLDRTTGDVYVRAAGTYSVVTNIMGPAGDDGTDGVDGASGSVWRDGSGVPSDSLGVDGDYYLDVVTGDVYGRAGGVYSLIGNLKGPSGEDTQKGERLALETKYGSAIAGINNTSVALDGNTIVVPPSDSTQFLEYAASYNVGVAGGGIVTLALYKVAPGGASTLYDYWNTTNDVNRPVTGIAERMRGKARIPAHDDYQLYGLTFTMIRYSGSSFQMSILNGNTDYSKTQMGLVKA